VRREPYRQGRLDSLCGLYALVNATTWALRGTAPLTTRDAQLLMQHLIADLEARGKLSAAMAYGLTIPAFGRVMDAAEDWLSDRKRVDLIREKPFHKRKRVSGNAFQAELKRHFSGANKSAVLMIHDHVKHWTVATGVSRTGMRLADSEERRKIQFSSCVVTARFRRNNERTHLIPQGLFLLTFQPH
jgi:hypothetical protein